MSGDSPASRARLARPALVLALTVALAFGVRAWRPEALGLGHYDEGVYALSALGAADPADRHLFPGQVRFSPPLWFMTVSVASQLTGVPPGQAALLLNVGVSTLVVVAAGVVGWAWFGPAAGAAGAMLLAGSQFQVMLGRTALTDPAFALLMLLAVAALGRGLSRGSLAWSAAGGILTGLAWNTKYHGWFVLAIALGAIAAAGYLRRREASARSWLRSSAGRWLLAAAIAAAMYLPWALYMRASSGAGGWRSIFEYYLGMLGTEWGANAGRHVAQQAFLEGALSRASTVAAVAAAAWAVRRHLVVGRTLATGLLVGVAAWLLGAAGVTVLLAVAGGLTLLRGRVSIEALLLLGWVALWFVAAPVYRPYARLLLPLGVVLSLLAGVGVDGLVRWMAHGPSGNRAVAAGVAGTVLATLALLLALADLGLRDAAGNPWRDGAGTARAAGAVAGLVPEGAPIVVIGEPSLVYYLLERGRRARELTESITVLDTVSTEVYIVAGVYANRAPALREGLIRLAPRLERLAQLDLAPSDLRLLDDLAPAPARAYRRAPDSTFALRVLRLAPLTSGPP